MRKVHYVAHTWIENVDTPGGPACGNWQKGIFKAAHNTSLVTCKRCRRTHAFHEARKPKKRSDE